MTTMTTFHNSMGQTNALSISTVKNFEHLLDDVMEIIDTTELKIKLRQVEAAFDLEPSETNKARLGIIYHETALNLSFFVKSEYKGYAQKSYDVLSELHASKTTTPELLPFLASYKASALSLVSAETRKLSLLSGAFTEFGMAAEQYASVSYLPEFLRGSVAENLPWFFFSKRKHASRDFESIIAKYQHDNAYANPKIMSFTYWAWANQHQNKKYRKQALNYLDLAISLDPDYKGGRKRAEELKEKLAK